MTAIHTSASAARLRGWAMTCAALVVMAGPAQAQTVAPAGAAAAQPSRPQVPELTRAEIDAALATPDKVLFLDLRRPDEISSIGGFPAYLNIQAAELEKSLAYVPRDRRIVTVSNHAGRARQGLEILKKAGFSVIGPAGVQDYEAQGGALRHKRPQAAAQTQTQTQATPAIQAQTAAR